MKREQYDGEGRKPNAVITERLETARNGAGASSAQMTRRRFVVALALSISAAVSSYAPLQTLLRYDPWESESA